MHFNKYYEISKPFFAHPAGEGSEEKEKNSAMLHY